MRKLTLLAGIAIGYVLGTRAGRGQYEKIKSTAREAWDDPRVQEKAAAAQQYVAETAPKVTEKAGEVASDLASRVTGSGSDDAGAGGALDDPPRP